MTGGFREDVENGNTVKQLDSHPMDRALFAPLQQLQGFKAVALTIGNTVVIYSSSSSYTNNMTVRLSKMHVVSCEGNGFDTPQ